MRKFGTKANCSSGKVAETADVSIVASEMAV